MIFISPEQLRSLMAAQPVRTVDRLPKRLRWTIPLMDDVVKEVHEKINKREKSTVDFAKIVDEVKKEMSAGKEGN